MAENEAVAVVEGVVAAAAQSVVDANARADAAAEVTALITEAAVQREISGTVDELEDEVEEWQRQLESVTSRLTAVEQLVATLQQSLTSVVTLEILTAELAKLTPPTPPPPPPHQDQTPPEARATHNPQDGEGDHPEAEPGPEKPAKKYRVS